MQGAEAPVKRFWPGSPQSGRTRKKDKIRYLTAESLILAQDER